MATLEITSDIAAKVLEVVDAGLSLGMGNPVPGEMCVEAAVCFAMGLPHGDDPACVSPALRSLKIGLNDSDWSSKQARAKGLRRLAVAQLGSKGVLDEVEFVKRVAESVIRKQVPLSLRAAAELYHGDKHKQNLLAAAERCEQDGSEDAARYAASDASDASYAASDAASDAARYAASAASDAARYAARAASDASDAIDAASAASDAARYAARAASYAARYAARAASDKVLSDFAEQVVQILIEMDAPGCQWLSLTE